MRRVRVTHSELLGADRQRVDMLREVNELRRSRALPEYQPRTTTFRVLPRLRRKRCVRHLRLGP
jgi:hypothetical protein